MDDPDVPRALARLNKKKLEVAFDPTDASYFLSTVELYLGDAPGLSGWRKRLFLATSQMRADAAEFFHLPRERTVIIGSRIEV